jgi:hypothetical protein
LVGGRRSFYSGASTISGNPRSNFSCIPPKQQIPLMSQWEEKRSAKVPTHTTWEVHLALCWLSSSMKVIICAMCAPPSSRCWNGIVADDERIHLPSRQPLRLGLHMAKHWPGCLLATGQVCVKITVKIVSGPSSPPAWRAWLGPRRARTPLPSPWGKCPLPFSSVQLSQLPCRTNCFGISGFRRALQPMRANIAG